MTTPVQQVIESLRGEFGTRISTGAAVREQHGRGEAFAQGFPPDAVIWPENTGEVSTILQKCYELRVPVIALDDFAITSQ
jgi:D-lactate dehydrogenase (cytochrome)